MTSTGRGASPDISVIVNGHREGATSVPTLAALARALEVAADSGLAVEVVGVLDRADEATVSVFTDALADDGIVGRLAPTRLVTTDLGDPGAARNEGVRLARGRWVCVLDGDNLPSRTWLREAHRAASTYGAPCVVHPEQLVIFGERWQVWPQLPSTDPGFRVHNFFDRTYWDTFCLAAREVFTAVPYAPTAAERGLGPEDWHWGMETVHAGYVHLVAPGTVLLYRDKPSDSVQGGHAEARSLLPPSALLTDPRLAATIPPPEDHREWRGLQRALVRDDHAPSRPPAVAPTPSEGRWRGRSWRRSRDTTQAEPPRPPRPAGEEPAATSDPHFDVLHYRALNAEALRLPDDQAVDHFLSVGRRAGLRASLSAAELRDVRALDLDDYSALHPDLAGLDDDGLLHHYLAHGRAEGRAISRTAEEREASRGVRLGEELVAELDALHGLEPAIPEPTSDNLAALRRTGPPSDGSTTRGSRAWWRVVGAMGAPAPQVVVLVSQAPPDPAADPRWATILSAAASGRRVAVVATRGGSDRPTWLPDPTTWVDLPSMDEWRQLPEVERRRLLATLVVQLHPDVVHVLDSAEFVTALDDYGPALRASTHLELPDGLSG